MKRSLVYLGFFALITAALMAACTDTTKPNPTTAPTAIATPAPSPGSSYDRMNDTSFSNVMAVLREALDAEKRASDSKTKLNTAKAYILVIKFIRTDRDKVLRSGMSDADIKFLVSDAREKATNRLKEIISSQTAPQALKDEANLKLKEMDAL